MDQNELISKSINNIRFPMILGVVFIHCGIACDDALCNSVQHLFSDLLPAACVPIFFLMSGFLFFWRVEEWNKDVFASKFMKRFRSLVIPYLFWITITIALFAGMHLFLPSLINPDFENVPKWGIKQYLAAYWNGSGGFPISYPLWFLRNLIVMVYLTPLFYLIIYKMGVMRWLWLMATAVWYYTNSSGTSMGLFYFYSGILLAYSIDKNLIGGGNSMKIISAVSLVAFASLIVLLMVRDDLPSVTNDVLRLSGTIGMIGMFIHLTNKGMCITKVLGESSFFIYLYHALPLMVLSRVLVKVFHPVSTMSWIALYYVNYLLIILIGISLYMILKRFLPRFTAFICGGR